MILFSCGDKKEQEKKEPEKTATGNSFIDQFLPLNLKYTFNDSSLMQLGKEEKALTIVGDPHFPDSLWQGVFAKNEKPKFYPYGRVAGDGNETYLFLKAIANGKSAAYLICYDSGRYRDGEMLFKADADPTTSYSTSIDKSFSITITETMRKSGEAPKISDRTLIYNRMGFLTEAVNNDPNQQLAIVNPIDTLPQMRRYSGDYGNDPNNFISIRDGRRDSLTFEFFYYFSKAVEDCKGEIKGEGRFTGPNTGVYQQDGDPCMINFQFTNNQVTVKEDHGCGNYRGMDCKFDGAFTKKKKTTPAPEKNTKTPGATENKSGKPAKTAEKKPEKKRAPVKNEEVY
jgi:hypothetical protein